MKIGYIGLGRMGLPMAERLIDAGHLRHRAFRIHPPHEDLRPPVRLGDIADPGAVRRPARASAFDQETLLGAIPVHDPEGGIPAVLLLVHPATGKDDPGSVGRNLGVTDLLPVEIVLHGEQGVGGRFLRGEHAGPARGHRERGRDGGADGTLHGFLGIGMG